MLLLVLILVLVAFALLVVALVQSSVLWAWLSVAISVGAAGALLFDWWQRQQAARADEEVPPPAPAPEHRVGLQAQSADYDSVTEFIPVTPQPGYGQGPARSGGYPPDSETRFLPQGHGAAPDSSGHSTANEQTVLLPVARPPGSTDRPPGAIAAPPAWGGPQSQSVTNSGPQGPESGVPSGPPNRDDAPGGEETLFQATDDEGAPQRTNGATLAPGQASPPEADSPGALFAAAPEEATTAMPAQPAEEADAPSAAGEPAQQAGEATELANPALPPAGPDGEPPEEPLVPAAAEIAASAEDEVVVVDERPRYHVAGCAFLPGRPVIALPVREAVELGFSPCGWCAPNRVLAERHQPAAR